MRTLGLIGGMSWESSAHYYRLVNEGVRARKGGLHSASLLMLSVDFAEIAALQHVGDWSALGRRMAAAARTLARRRSCSAVPRSCCWLVGERGSAVPLFDTTALHAAAAVAFMVEV